MKAKFFSSLGVSLLILWIVTWNWNTPIPVYFFRLPGLEQHAPHLYLTFYGLVIWTAVIVGVPFTVFNIVNRRHYQEQARQAKKKADRLLEDNVRLQEQIDLVRAAGVKVADETEEESNGHGVDSVQADDSYDPFDDPGDETDLEEEIQTSEGNEHPPVVSEGQDEAGEIGGLMDMIRGRKREDTGEESG